GEIGIGPVLRPQIVTVRPGSPAERGGLRPGDAILAVGERHRPSHEQVIDGIQASANTALPIVVERDGEQVTLSVIPEGPEGEGLIGVELREMETRVIDPSLAEAFQLSLQENWESTL